MQDSDLDIVLRVDANASIGRGHAVRAAALLDAFQGSARLCVAGSGDDLRSLFPDAEMAEPDSFFDRCGRADLAIVDHPDLHWIPTPNSALRVVIDDSGLARAGDLIVNGSAPGSRHGYRQLEPEVTRLCGTEYSLLRPEFSEAALPPDARRKGLVVVTGSGETARQWILGLAEAPPRWADEGVTLVVGASFPDFESLRDRSRGGAFQLLRDLDASELAALLASSAVALTTGGMIVSEALAAGCCCIAFANEADLLEEIETLSRRGALLSLGKDASPAAALATLGELARSPESLLALRIAARRQFDGLGVRRVYEAISTLLGERSVDG